MGPCPIPSPFYTSHYAVLQSLCVLRTRPAREEPYSPAQAQEALKGRLQRSLAGRHRENICSGYHSSRPHSTTLPHSFLGLQEYWESPWATFSRGRSRWRNQYLVDHLQKHGIDRSKKQVASHIQVLRNMWKGEPGMSPFRFLPLFDPNYPPRV